LRAASVTRRLVREKGPKVADALASVPGNRAEQAGIRRRPAVAEATQGCARRKGAGCRATDPDARAKLAREDG
jgi:hypothetical protein